jgi:hypothetical protein
MCIWCEFINHGEKAEITDTEKINMVFAKEEDIMGDQKQEMLSLLTLYSSMLSKS